MEKTLVNVYQESSNSIKHIYLQDGKIHHDSVKFKPFLGVYDKNSKSGWTDIYGKPIKIRQFDSISEMREWKKENKEFFDILGDVNPTIQFIATEYKKDIPFSKDGLKIFNIDIEVHADSFPIPEQAKYPINAITINEMISNMYITFATGDYVKKNPNEVYMKCSSECDLIEQFLEFWNKHNAPIITGWNIDGFDIPYLVNRITNVFDVETAKKLSKDRKIGKHETSDTSGNSVITYSLQGHIIWDYLNLYKKYTQEKRESYSLDNISKVELGDEKIKYHDEYENLSDLYLKDFQTFIEYNIKDTNLVWQLDQKLRYIDLAMTIMHKAKCQPEQIFKTVGPWDCIIYNRLLKKKVLCPPSKHNSKIDFVGGYVAEPVPGLYEWVEVVDIVSSYPNQLISFNMSPETILPDSQLPDDLLKFKMKYTGIEKCVDIDQLEADSAVLKKYNVSFTSNGYFFKNDKQGILPEIFSDFFAQRKAYKKDIKKFEAEGLKHEAIVADLFQYTMKILLNSGYGFLSNIYSRYFDIRIAEAITSNGQVCVRGATKAITDKFKIKCIYNDTDSSFFDLAPIIKKRFGHLDVDKKTKLDFLLKFDEECIQPELKRFFTKMANNMNMRNLTIGMEAECIADGTLFVAKKRYIMNKVWDEGKYLLDNPKRKIRGVEIVRSSTPMIVRDKLKKAVDIIFTTMDNEKLVEFVEEFKEEFYKLPIETIAFPRSVTMGDYTLSSKGLPIGVKAALVYNKLLQIKGLDTKLQKIQDSDKIKFCYIVQPNIMQSHVLGFINKMPVELLSTFKINYNEQFKTAFINPLENIISAIGWSTERSRSLEDFFS